MASYLVLDLSQFIDLESPNKIECPRKNPKTLPKIQIISLVLNFSQKDLLSFTKMTINGGKKTSNILGIKTVVC